MKKEYCEQLMKDADIQHDSALIVLIAQSRDALLLEINVPHRSQHQSVILAEIRKYRDRLFVLTFCHDFSEKDRKWIEVILSPPGLNCLHADAHITFSL